MLSPADSGGKAEYEKYLLSMNNSSLNVHNQGN